MEDLTNASEYKNRYRDPKATHYRCLIDYLDRYGSITPLEALIAFGCMRLGARVWEARHVGGYNIQTYRHPEDKYAKYTLVKGDELWNGF